MWTLKTKTISGGDPKVADAFNNAVHASAQHQLDGITRDADPDPTRPWTFETNPRIFFGAASVSELIDGLFMAEHAAHPTSVVSTVVIDSRSASPITLKDLFADEQKGLDRLSQQTKMLLPAVMGSTTTPMADEPGTAPTEDNFANWIPTPEGMQINFKDYQFGHGTPVLTVPWPALDDVLAPGMETLRQS